MLYLTAAALAIVAVAPGGGAQQISKLTVVAPLPEPATIDSSTAFVVPAVKMPTIDTATPIAVPKDARKKSNFLTTAPGIEMQNYRPEDKRGINIFEAPKDDSLEYTGFKLQWGAAFTQQFQGLDHYNTAAPRPVTTAGVTTNANQLIRIGHGPNNATANLYLNAQLARGIRVAMTTYSSARHHNETWVKDGYLLVDASPIDWKPLNDIMKYVTIRAGHFEINYGDAHFRRTDNGNSIRNPLIGNYIMDAFTTEVGGEVYVRRNGFLAMAGVTGGESRGMITSPEKRTPSYLMKVGFDKTIFASGSPDPSTQRLARSATRCSAATERDRDTMMFSRTRHRPKVHKRGRARSSLVSRTAFTRTWSTRSCSTRD
jgi:hypothetical protein